MFLWALTRIYILPQFIYYLFVHEGIIEKQFNPFIRLNCALLLVMFLLHAFWFFVFFKIIGRYCMKGSVDDLGKQVEKKQEWHKKIYKKDLIKNFYRNKNTTKL